MTETSINTAKCNCVKNDKNGEGVEIVDSIMEYITSYKLMLLSSPSR